MSISTLNIEKVAVTAHFAGFVAPYHYIFSVRGVAVTSGDSSVPDLTVEPLQQLLDHDAERVRLHHRHDGPGGFGQRAPSTTPCVRRRPRVTTRRTTSSPGRP